MFTYFCKTKSGKKFRFNSDACLDIGIQVKDPLGEDGIIEDMTYDYPIVSGADLSIDRDIDYELARGLSL